MSTCIPGFCVGCAPRQANSSGRVGGTGPPRAGVPEGRTVSLWALRGLAYPLQVGGGCTEPRGQQGNLETGGPPERVTLDSPKATGEHTQSNGRGLGPQDAFKKDSRGLSWVGAPMGFSRQEYWSGLPVPLPGDLPNLGIKPVSPVLAGGCFTPEPPGKCHACKVTSFQIPLSPSLWT